MLRRCYRFVPALVSFVAAVCLLWPYAATLPQHDDEAQYGWSAAYYAGKLARLDFHPAGSDRLTDPGWDPLSPWSLTQPMGARFVYGLALRLTGAPVPSQPRLFVGNQDPPPETLLSPATLHALRVTGLLCAALGLALFSLRLGWRGLIVTGGLLVAPWARADLARAWAEGPLLLGFGLCAVAYGTRWFAPACGLAATFKLTALGLWPLLLLRDPTGRPRRPAPLRALLPAALAWALLTPPSWFLGGPLYLPFMLVDRVLEHNTQSSDGFFFASRYAWPFLLLLALGAAWMQPRLTARLRPRPVGPARAGSPTLPAAE